MKTSLEQAIDYINEWEISNFFEFVKSKKGENALLNQLAKRFMTNKHDENYDEQLRLLATWLLSENQTESKKAEQALVEKGTITVQDAQNVVLGNMIQAKTIQIADKIYNIENANNSTFN